VWSSCRVVLKPEATVEAVRREFVLRLRLCGEIVKSDAQRSLSVPGRTEGPSSPGEPPHAITGRLRNDVRVNVDEATLTCTVGCALNYAIWLEFGTLGGRRIEPKTPGGVLSWVGADGVRRFAKWVIQGPIKPRPFLRPALDRNLPRIRQILTAPLTGRTGPSPVQEVQAA
jgi:hypothetical protein